MTNLVRTIETYDYDVARDLINSLDVDTLSAKVTWWQTTPLLATIYNVLNADNRIIRRNSNACDKKKWLSIAYMLLDKGVDVNVKNYFGSEALYYCCQSKDLETLGIKLIDMGADVNTKRSDNDNALITASHNCLEKLVHKLLEKKADVDVATRLGTTALIASFNFCENYGQSAWQCENILLRLIDVCDIPLHLTTLTKMHTGKSFLDLVHKQKFSRALAKVKAIYKKHIMDAVTDKENVAHRLYYVDVHIIDLIIFFILEST